MQTAVIGSGAWGTTLAKILAENGHSVDLWCHDQALADDINQKHENVQLFAGVKLPENIRAVTSFTEAGAGKQLIVVVTASKFIGSTVKALAPVLPPDAVIASATKGLNPGDNKRPSELLRENLPPERWRYIAVLSGPNIAREIAARKPAATVCSAENLETAQFVQKAFSSPYFRVYTNDDTAAAEFGGTLKNVIAIAAGIVDGLELGDNAKSALMVRGMVEIIRFGTHFGARPESFYGLAGMGDLITTCSSKMSRNHYVGENLAAGKTLDEILKGMTAVAEGVEAARLIFDIAKREKISMPVTEQVHAILFENKPVDRAILELMTRDLKGESVSGA
ncbi:MAG: NAD(P)-dependent glycerol-3-phosphate dehydrogenase [Leptospirales bacterium]|nr:NAD(P)-dependent glycerol-3-phosphate dehydrogenase [Leptospirales bacterium]